MIYRMLSDITDGLRTRKFPVRFEYGPTRVEHEGFSDFLLVGMRDDVVGDSVAAPHGQQRNPRYTLVRSLGVMVELYARSPEAGARRNEHEHVCDSFVDGFLCELYEWTKSGKAGDVAFSEARYVSADERDGLEAWPGVVYRMRFQVQRGVFRRDFEGFALPEATLYNITTSLGD